MLSWLPFILLFSSIALTAPYKCGEKKTIKRPYGVVELRVECNYLTDKRRGINVIEYKGDVQHGFQIGYDSLWRKHDSSFFINEKAEGQVLIWDTLGNIAGKRFYKNGKQVGKSEFFWSPGKPSNITNYNDSGRAEGLEQVWWPNGNKKRVATNSDGLPIAEEEYYPNGILRWKRTSTLNGPYWDRDRKINYMESFTPKGKSTGKVIDGNGEIWLISEKLGTNGKEFNVIHKIYKNDLDDSSTILSPKEAAKFLK